MPMLTAAVVSVSLTSLDGQRGCSKGCPRWLQRNPSTPYQVMFDTAQPPVAVATFYMLSATY